MIWQPFLNAVYRFVDFLMVFQIPDLPEEVYAYIDTVFEYIVAGAGLLGNYVPLGYLMSLFGVLLAVDAGIVVYHLVMWILKKIPVLGIE